MGAARPGPGGCDRGPDRSSPGAPRWPERDNRVVSSIGEARIIDLTRLDLTPGGGRRLEVAVAPGPLELAGQRYGLQGDPPLARIDVSRTAAGWALRLRFEARVRGPCMRCLGEASVGVAVDAREVEHPDSRDEELRSPYVSAEELDLGAWAYDALALAMPEQHLCRSDCAGLCPVCGESLNDPGPEDHAHERALDPRWEKLRELRLD